MSTRGVLRAGVLRPSAEAADGSMRWEQTCFTLSGIPTRRNPSFCKEKHGF